MVGSWRALGTLCSALVVMTLVSCADEGDEEVLRDPDTTEEPSSSVDDTSTTTTTLPGVRDEIIVSNAGAMSEAEAEAIAAALDG